MNYSGFSKEDLILRIKQLEKINECLQPQPQQSFSPSESSNSDFLPIEKQLSLKQSLLNASKLIPQCKSFEQAAHYFFKELKDLVLADAGYIALLNKETQMNEVVFLEPGSQKCTVDPNLLMPIRGFRKTVYQSKEVKYHNDFSHSKWIDLMPKGHTTLHNIMFIPMLVNDEAIGLIGLSNKAGGFTDEDAIMAKEFGALAVIALKYSKGIEENILAEKKLKESEERFRLMTDDSPIMIWESGLNAQCTYFNKQWLTFRGREMKEEVGDGWTEGIHPDDFEYCVSNYLKAFHKHVKFKLEYRLKNAQGDYRWILDIGSPRFKDNGEFDGYIGSCIDITERRFVEQTQKEKEEFYYALFEKNKAVKLLIDPISEKIMDASSSACDFYGYSMDELTALKISDINQLSRDEIYAEMQEALTEGRSHFEFEHKLANGDLRDVMVFSSPIQYKGNNLLYSIIYDITALKRTERKLIQSEARYKNLVENAPDIVYIFSNLRGNLFCSERVKDILGYLPVDLYQDPFLWYNSIHSEDKSQIEKMLTKGNDEFSRDMTYRIKDKKGNWHWFRDRLIGKKQIDDEIIIEGIATDITSQKNIEYKLKESEEKFRLIVNALPQLISYCSADFKYLYVNQTYEKEFGLKQEEIFNKSIVDVIGEKAFNQAQDHLQRVIKGESVRYYEKFTYKNGIKKHVDGQLIPHFDTHEKVIGYYGVLTDISPYMETRAELEKSEKEKSVILDSMSEMLTYCDRDLNIIWANKAAREYRSTMTADLQGKKCYQLWNNKNSPCEDCCALKAIDSKEMKECEVQTFDHKSFKLRVYPVLNASGEIEGFVEFGLDITEQKKNDKELKKIYNLYRTLASNLPGINVFLFDPDKRIIIAEGSDFREGVLKKSDFEGRLVPELDFEKELVNFLDYLYAEALKGNRAEGELKYNNEWYYHTAVPIQNVREKVIGGLVVVQNITEAKKATLELEDSKQKLKQLAAYTQDIIEKEKSHVAREIHDELGQNLTFIKLNLSLLYNNLSEEIDGFKPFQFKNLYEVVDQTIKKVKEISSNLRPGLIDDLGLIPAVEWHVSEFFKQTGLKCGFEYNQEHMDLDKDLAINIFRIIQEALTNCIKYAQASEVRIAILKIKKNLILSIKDNGKGIEKADLNKQDKLGILGMKERVELFSGTFSIKGTRNRGTEIKIKIPFKN